MDSECIFCKIANGIIPSATVYEDNDFRAILDIAPSAKGHTLIIPKKHMTDLLEGDNDILNKAFPLSKKIANAVKKTLNCDGINILQNNGEAAGQSVFHFHIHIIPRYNNDEFTLPWKTLNYKEDEMKTLSDTISKNI